MKVALTKTARKLRGDTTDAELCLWRALRDRQIHGFKFKRQVPQGPYVIDFICIDRKLIIEVDGGQHMRQADADRRRTEYFERGGYRVLRFWNNEVLKNLDGVLETIVTELCDESPLTQPPPPGERAFAETPALHHDDSGSVPSPLGERDVVRGALAVRGSS
jgi:very-short-patch-repair endonuclease